ncbi:MAG: hypothetical protein A2091_10350 [Desulfuromonadales bacterium GWD2_61_12]|nr:MAG: hypothetical protein A2005_05320 [Desulfuromonadales bacterium GWC2_61_20]OGR34065.1 MAG: hypothetical protein A2091_10350 [Desulfuromonadales bacterium GWD2_61_12]HAD03493.1 hypothetical protein [Desulfuromonas sp.]HBT82794.1 hypothetical protein [Desulfuromonas sp.]
MFLVAVFLLLLVSGAAAGVAIGPYVDLAGGGGEMEWDTNGNSWDNGGFSTNEWDVDAGSGAIGFVLDTAPTGPAPFNYRLNVGLEAQTLEDDFGIEMNLGGLVVENVFGFAIMRKPNLRWWAGPLLRFGFYSGETDTFYFLGDRTRTEADLFELGVGAVTGVNIPIGKNKKVILAPSAGVRFIGIGGEATVKNLDTGVEFTDDISGGISMAFVNFALLFD